MQIEYRATRDAYGEALIEIGMDNSRVVVIDADLSESTQSIVFRKKFPTRFINVGCAEQNMVGVAAGLSLTNRVVFISSYAIFLCRAWEQIRNTIAYDDLNVKIVVSHSGFTNSRDGASHQSLEDIGLMNTISNLRIYNPCDFYEAKRIILDESKKDGPAYIRLNREKTPIIFNDNYQLHKGCQILTEGSDIALFATGTMVHLAIEASTSLYNLGYHATVINIPIIKPIDRNEIIQILNKCGKGITIEEHSLIGGIGSIISSISTDECPVPIRKIGVHDCFGETGTYKDLLRKHNLTLEHIIEQAKNMLKISGI